MAIVAVITNAARDTNTFFHRAGNLQLLSFTSTKVVVSSVIQTGQFAGDPAKDRIFGTFDTYDRTGPVTRWEQAVNGKTHFRITYSDPLPRLGDFEADWREPVRLYGNDYDNDLALGLGSDLAYGKAGNDDLRGLTGHDQILGGKGDDFLSGGGGNDKLRGSADNDTVQGGKGNDTLEGNGGNDSLAGGAGADTLLGGEGEDRLTGDDSSTASRDVLDGGRGKDELLGGALSDTLTGGSHADTFIFNKVSDSEAGNTRDTITDFDLERDLIDLSNIDANATKNGNQSFNFIGNADFSGKAGELRASGSRVAADVDGDGKADFQIGAAGAGSMTEDHFIL